MSFSKYTLVSVKTVVDKVYRDLNLQDESRWASMIEWICDGLEHIGIGSQLIIKTKNCIVKDYKAELPCDFVSILSLSKANKSAPAMVHGMQTKLKPEADNYTVNKGYFNFSFTDEEIELTYKGLELDEDGFPMIPNDISFLEALFFYCVMKLMIGGYESKVFNYQIVESRWHWYCTQAKTKFNMPDINRMESLKNMWLRLIPKINRHSNFFRSANAQESINV